MWPPASCLQDQAVHILGPLFEPRVGLHLGNLGMVLDTHSSNDPTVATSGIYPLVLSDKRPAHPGLEMLHFWSQNKENLCL
eukprot:Gb_40859 [translate_table: standard]